MPTPQCSIYTCYIVHALYFPLLYNMIIYIAYIVYNAPVLSTNNRHPRACCGRSFSLRCLAINLDEEDDATCQTGSDHESCTVSGFGQLG